jgi:hypothetical protein
MKKVKDEKSKKQLEANRREDAKTVGIPPKKKSREDFSQAAVRIVREATEKD